MSDAAVAPLAAAREAFAAGDNAGVLQQLAPWLAHPQASDELLGLAANAALRLGAPDRALEPLQRLHARHPASDALRRALSMAANNWGARLRREHDLAGAGRAFAQALSVWADNADALYNQAQLLVARQDPSAIDLLRRLHALKPDDVETTLELADLELRRADADVAAWAARLLAIDDASAAARLAGLAERVHDHDAVEPARAIYARAATLSGDGARAPGLRARIASALLLPAVHDDRAALQSARARYADGLERLHAFADDGRLAAIEPRLAQLQWSNFLLAYQGEDDRALQERYGQFVQRALAVIEPKMRVAPDVPARARPRIGLVSSGFRHCTVGSYFGAWIDALTRAGFETVVFALGPGFDATTDALARDATSLVRLDDTVDAMAAIVREARLDLLIHPDVGMDARTQVLAACRLAPRQVAAWGHPVTTGLASIDGYLTCGAMEADGADAHYREALHRLPGIGTAYAFPPAPEPRTRESLGLPAGPLYLVPQSSFKIHPDNDATIAALASRDPDATFVLFTGPARGADAHLRRRLGHALREVGADPGRQLHVRPHASRAEYLQVCAACDVMIDTQHWSGGNATLDALRAGVPVVTVPGRYMRGRQSAAMLAQIGLADALLCADAAQQVERAQAIAGDRAHRAALSRAIADGLPILADGRAALAALVDFVHTQLATPTR